MSGSTTRKKAENQNIINETVKNISKIEQSEIDWIIKLNIANKSNDPQMYDRIDKINKLYSGGLYKSYQENYRDAVLNAIITYGSQMPTHQLMQTMSPSPAEKVELINQKFKNTSEVVVRKLKESLLSLEPQTQNQHLKQQFDNIIKILDNPDTSRPERLVSNIKKSLSSPNLNNATSNVASRIQSTQTGVNSKTNQYTRAVNNQSSAIYSQKLNEVINILDEVAVFKLAKLIGNVKQETGNLDEYFTKINKTIAVIKRSNDPDAIKALDILIKPIEKFSKNKNSIQQFNNIKLILNQQNISSTDAKKLSKAMASLEQDIKNQYSIKLDNIIALLNDYEYNNLTQTDSKSQNIKQAKTSISIKGIIKEVKSLLRMLAQMFSSNFNNKKSNTKNAELSNTPIKKKRRREPPNTKTNTKVSNINSIIYDADKVITLESGAVYILDEKNLVRAFQLPGKPIRFLTEQKGVEFNERLNKHMANRDLNNITSDKSANQEYNKPAGVESGTSDATPPPKPPRTYEYQVGDINDNHYVSHDSQTHTTPSHDRNNSESNLQNADSRQDGQQTSSLDHILKEDKGIAETAGINLQHKIHRPSRQLMQNSSRSRKFTSKRAFETAKSKNNTRVR